MLMYATETARTCTTAAFLTFMTCCFCVVRVGKAVVSWLQSAGSFVSPTLLQKQKPLNTIAYASPTQVS